MRQRVSERLRIYWWLWLAIAVVAVIANELVDRKVAGDENGHPVGDILVATLIVLLAASVWELVASNVLRRRGS